MRIEAEKRKVEKAKRSELPTVWWRQFRFGAEERQATTRRPKAGRVEIHRQIFPEIHGFFGDGLFGFEYRKHRKKLVSFGHKH